MKAWYNQKEREMKILIEDPEDLIYLEQFLEKGSFVKGVTFRSKEIIRDGKKVKVGKERIVVTVEAEKVELKENSLRVLGKIVDASKEVSGYHSLEIKPGDTIFVKKDWKNWEIEKLRKLRKVKEPVLVVIMDERDCSVFVIGDRVEEKGEIRRSGGKREIDESVKVKYFSEIFEVIKDWDRKIIVAGPGFAKEEFRSFLREKGINVVLDSVSHTGKNGLEELIRRGTIGRVLDENRIEMETEIVERFFEEISKDGLVVYGEDEVKKAVESFALEKLLISDVLIREKKYLIDLAEESGAEIIIISSKHPAGEKFYHFGGLGGFLRFKT